jgi:hypothetical protein
LATATAQFASRRSDLILVERPAAPIFEGGRQIGTTPGKYHQFRDHRLRVEGQKSIDFIRARAKAPDSPEVWELDATDVPSTNELLSEMLTADVARVREILAAETATHGPNREPVVEGAKRVLEKMGAAERGPGRQKADPRHELVG